VAGNLPYNVASPILFKLLALRGGGLPIGDAQVMLQREVADRLTAPPGTKDYGVLSVLIRHHADADCVLTLPPGAFRPSPKVHSAVVRLRFHPPDPAPRDADVFTAMTRAIFTRRRKTLANALQAYRSGGIVAALERAGLDGRRRPETLTIGELVELSDALAGSG
jgi:16S rRNA (adenine1518-N6/adenine1519-N6)-dimethyltransferase